MIDQFGTVPQLVTSAFAVLLVVSAGSLATRLCRQPVHRVQVILLTLIGALIAPWLSLLPAIPHWSADVLPAEPARRQFVSAASSSMPQPQAIERSTETTANPVRPIANRAQPAKMPPAAESRSSPAIIEQPQGKTLSFASLILVGYGAIIVGFIAWWLFGQIALWLLTRNATPASSELCAILNEVAGRAGGRVRLLESSRIALPATYTFLRPVILLPCGLDAEADRELIRYMLAHEWSHVERRDSWAWSFTCLASALLFYQPLFWWLRRQLRLCQDFLADARAAASGSPEDYASHLVRLARFQTSGRYLPALGISDRRSNLSRRVTMLVQNREPLALRCRTIWSLTAASIACGVIVAASSLRLNAATTPDEPVAKQEAKKAEADRVWKCHLVEKGTGKPVAGAKVVVEISTSGDAKTNEPRTLREVPQTSGADGAYEFSITPEENALPRLYITLHVDSANHIQYFGGYSYGMILKNITLGERPFFEKLEIDPGKAIEGIVKSPDGKPVADVKVGAYSSPDKDPTNSGRFSETKTDAQGRFHLVIHPQGPAGYWILPQDFAPEQHGLKPDQRGDLGTFTLKKGVVLRGKAVDENDKPVAGIFVEANQVEKGTGDESLIPQWVAGQIHRATITKDDGSFEFRPLPEGAYSVTPTDRGWDPSTREGAHDPARRPLPATFMPTKVTLKDAEKSPSIELKAVPHIVFTAQLYNSKREKRSGHEFWLSGEINKVDWNAQCASTPDGLYRVLVPKGLQEAQIMLVTNEHSSLMFRTKKDGELHHARTIHLGSLDRDSSEVEIIRYVAPIILINAVTKDGKQVKGFRPSVDYVTQDGPAEGKYVIKGDGQSDVSFEEQADGKWRTSQLAPDREVTVSVKAAGFAPATRTMTLTEGKTEEVTFTLTPE